MREVLIMNDIQQKQLGAVLWGIADKLRGTMNADDFRDYMLSFLFLRYLSLKEQDKLLSMNISVYLKVRS